MRSFLATMLGVSLLVASAATSAARQTATEPVPDMQVIAADLGVACAYCHGGRENPPAVTASGKPRLAVAREMIAMTAELNARVQSVTGKPAAQAVRVRCVTCHRGVAIPRQLQDIIWQTIIEQGPEPAVAQYRDLRTRYYGRQSYDFGEETLLAVADRLATARPPDAIALARLNLEFYPRSARSYVTLAIAQSRTDLAAAIESLRKSLEIDPDNGMTRGRLYQLEEDLKRRSR
jgi:tetratricopeptide (TPR) repeat protein